MRTLQEIENCEKEMLTPKDVAKFLSCDAYSISLQAKENPKALGFPVIVIGTRTKIPRDGFVNFCRWYKANSATLDERFESAEAGG